MEEIETKKRKRMDTAAAWCRFQQLNYRRQFDGFEYQANVHFIVSCDPGLSGRKVFHPLTKMSTL